jgi:hypothetical protein
LVITLFSYSYDKNNTVQCTKPDFHAKDLADFSGRNSTVLLGEKQYRAHSISKEAGAGTSFCPELEPHMTIFLKTYQGYPIRK